MNKKQINEYLRVVLMLNNVKHYELTQIEKTVITIHMFSTIEDWQMICLTNSLDTMFKDVKLISDSLGNMLRITIK